MGTIEHTFAFGSSEGQHFPITNATPYATAVKGTKVPFSVGQKDGAGVGKVRRGISSVLRDISTLSRTARVLSDLHCARPVSDSDLLQHREDCRFLMELAHERFLISDDPKDLAEARLWMYRWQEAIQRLSPEWKANREAQIAECIGAAYFIEQGTAARTASND